MASHLRRSSREGAVPRAGQPGQTTLSLQDSLVPHGQAVEAPGGRRRGSHPQVEVVRPRVRRSRRRIVAGLLPNPL
eukprot:4184387-Pyramimonas_sp.AAC.1